MPSKQVYARQRLMAGLILGFLGQLVIAFILGIVLVGGFAIGVRLTGTLISSVIATPAMLTVGFACMLKPDNRSFGSGILAGALVSTVLLAIGYLLV